MSQPKRKFETPVPKSRAARRVRSILENPTPALLPPWSDGEGWAPAPYSGTIRTADIDGDGKSELVARAAAGVQLWWFDVVAANWIMLASEQCGWTDANGWSDVSRALTIRLADVNGDGICELVARNATGVEIWQYSPASATCTSLATAGCNWTDAQNWNLPQYYSTILCADVNGDGVAEIIGRGANGIEVWSLASGAWKQLSANGCGWTDAALWNQPQYYSTILTADVNGDGIPELIGRGANGIEVWSFQGNAQWTQLGSAGCGWSDANLWNQAPYYATIRAADVNGDGSAELIGRSATGIELWSVDASGTFTQLGSGGCGWDDATDWNQAPYYMTIRAADVNGDGKAEITARGANGLQTFEWETSATGGGWVEIGTDHGALTDANGWTEVSCYTTFVAGDINLTGALAMMGRSPQGMVSMVFSAASGWQAPAPLIKVESRFSQNYLMDVAVPGGAEMAAAMNSAGGIELFIVGSNNHIFNMYPDPTSDTGWSSMDTGYTGNCVAVGQAPPTSGGQLVMAVFDGAITLAMCSSPGEGPRQWTTLEWPSAPFGVLRPMLRNAGSNLYFGALQLNYNSKNEPVFNFVTASWNWGVNSNGFSTAQATAFAQAPAGTVGCAVFCSDPDSDSFGYWGFLSSGETGGLTLAGTVKPKIVPAPSSSIPPGAENNLLYLPQAWTQVYQINGGTVQLSLQTNGMLAFLVNGQVQGTLNAVVDAGVTPPQTVNLPLSSFASAMDSQGELHVFGCGTDQKLYHTRYANSEWSEMVDLGQTVSSLVMAGFGFPDVFAANAAANNVTHAWQDIPSEATGSGTLDWQTEQVEVESGGAIQAVSTYTTELTVVDSYGQAQPGSLVTVSASDRTMVVLNGGPAWVGNGHTASANANAAGQVTIVTQANSLSTPLLNIWTDQMPSGVTVVVEPNADVQAELGTITGAELGKATDAEGNPIVPSQYQGQEDQLASIINQCMSMVQPEEDSLSTPAPVPRAAARLARHSAVFSSRIDSKAVKEQHWRARIGGGKISFEPLTAAAAAQAFALPTANLEGWFSLPDWGDIWDSIRDVAGAITDTLEVIVSTVADGIQVAINFVSDTAKYVWNGVISLVEQAFDLIEGVFETIGTAFSQLFEWLAFLFDWQDILNTKNALSYLLQQMLGAAPAVANWIQPQIDASLQSWKTAIEAQAHTWAESVAGRSNALSAQEQTQTTTSALGSAQSHNVVSTAFLNNAGAAPEWGPGGALTVGISGDAGGFIDALMNEMGTITSDTSFQNALENLKNSFANFQDPIQALRDAMAAFLELVGGFAGAACEVVQFAFDAVIQSAAAALQAFGAILIDPWNIPFVSPLYAFITSTKTNPDGDPLTALDLFSLVVAIPTTVLYKAIMGEAPFADLSTFQQQTTTASILNQLGITPSPSAGLSIKGEGMWFLDEPSVIALACTFGAVSVLYAVTSAIVDIDPAGLGKVPITAIQKTLSKFNVLCEWYLVAVGGPLGSATKPSNLSIVGWALGSILPISDLCFLLTDAVVPEYLGDKAVAATGLLGLAEVTADLVCTVLDGQPLLVALGTAAGFLPNVLKFARTAWAYESDPWLLGVLAGMDVVCLPMGAAADLYVTIEGLLSVEPSPSAAAASA